MALKRISHHDDYQSLFKQCKNEILKIEDGALIASILDLHYKIEKNIEKLQFKSEWAEKDKARVNSLLKRTSEDLNSSLAAEKKFLASMSHEIRTPLNAIIGFIELLNRTSLNTKQREFTTNVRLSSDHLLSLINDVLDVSKIEAGQMELNEKEIDLESVLMETVMLTSSKVPENVELITDFNHLDFMVKADALRIKQIFVNLLGNACKFTQEGFIRFSLLDYRPRGNEKIWLKFCIEDSGIGIPENKIEKLFSAFSQAHSHEHEGTGLGLYLSKSIASVMGGSIYVESIEGKGTHFFVELIVTKGSKRAKEYNFSEQKILFVEGDEHFAKQLTQKLERANSQLTCLAKNTTLRDISKNILANEYDLLILDVDKLGRSITSLAELAIQIYPNILVIGTTHNDQTLGLTEYLTILQKPFPFYMLSNLIKDHQEQRITNNSNDFSKMKILLVEDVRMNVMLIKAMLSKYFNLSFEHVVNGKKAVDKVKHNTYDMVFMDIQMPVMDGLTATKLIREFDQNTPIYAMTANAFAEDSEKALAVGMDGFITKPIKKQDIEVALQEVLNRE